jgi:Kef-type K+ transport system membrane component KefB/Trk K+ transport system NAD-binding subunit
VQIETFLYSFWHFYKGEKRVEQIFIQLGLVLLIAFIVSYLVRIFKQPIVIGYILAGVVASLVMSAGLMSLESSSEIINLFSKFGIAFLLFMVGLNMNPKVIKEIGFVSMIVGIGQIVFTFLLGAAFCYYLFNFNFLTSVYIGIALAFSSTIIVMKILSDKRNIDSLYGKISIGILIVQDLVAIFVLMLMSSLTGGNVSDSSIFGTLISGGALILVLFSLGYFILPYFVKKIAESQELLFLFSICWCFVIAALFNYFGFSIEIGALLAGMVLSISKYSIEISAKIKPLRDFFLVIFFIILGLNIRLSNIGSVFVIALILSIFALLLKPIITMGLMVMAGYTKRTNFLVGTAIAQISEFSLIILALGVSSGQISPEILSTLTLTGIITIALSTYMMIYSNNIYRKLSKFLSIFEKRNLRRDKDLGKEYDAILFGYNRIGFGILESFKKIKKKYLIVDFNPEIIEHLSKFRVPCVYGDAYDCEFLKELPLKKLGLAVSTIPDFETNVLLLEHFRDVNPNAIIILRAGNIKDALEFYKRGASYVLTPHFLGGEYVARMIIEDKTKEKGYRLEKEKHIKMLDEMVKRGHEHPGG